LRTLPRYGFVSNLRCETDIALVTQLGDKGITTGESHMLAGMPPFIASETSGRMPNGQAIRGYFALVPFTGEQMLSLPRPVVTDCIVQAINMLGDCGCRIVGLGAFTGSALTAGGRRLQGRARCALTTGNTYTAAVTLETISDLIGVRLHRNIANQRYAIVGATGSVGNALARSMADVIGERGGLLLVARNVRMRVSRLCVVNNHGAIMHVFAAQNIAISRRRDNHDVRVNQRMEISRRVY